MITNAGMSEFLNENSSVVTHGKKEGICNGCRKPSNMVCKKCGDFYCSERCQRMDWPKHRYICFPVPPLIKPQAWINQTKNDDFNTMLQPPYNVEGFLRQNPELMPQLLQAIIKLTDERVSQSQRRKHEKSRKVEVVIPPAMPMPPKDSRVILSSFHSPNRCFVRSSKPEDMAAYESLTQKVNDAFKSAAPITETPKIDSYALGEKDGKIYRVKMQGMRGETHLRALCIDVGHSCNLQLKCMRQIPPELASYAQQAILVQLHGVENYARNEQLNVLLDNMENMEYRITYNDELPIQVELFNLLTLKSVNKAIKEFCGAMELYRKNIASEGGGKKKNDKKRDTQQQKDIKDNPNDNEEVWSGGGAAAPTPQAPPRAVASARAMASFAHENFDTPAKPIFEISKPTTPATPFALTGAVPRTPAATEVVSRVMEAPFAMLQLDIKERDFEVIVLDNSMIEEGYFSCIRKIDVLTFLQVQKFTEKFNDPHPYKPREGEYVMGKFEGTWFRARVLECLSDDEFNVEYVDYGNEHTISPNDIRRYPPDLTDDCCSILCLLHNFSKKPEAVSFIKKKVVPEKRFIIDKIHQVEDDMMVVEISSLKKEMMEVGLF